MTKRLSLEFTPCCGGVSEKFSSHLSSLNLTSIDLRLYKHLQWHCFNWPILRLFMDNQASVDQWRLQSQKQKQTERMKRFSVFEHNIHFKQETRTFCAEMPFPQKGWIWLSLEGGRKFKSITDLQT